MEHKGYSYTYKWEETDNCFVAKIEGITDNIRFHAKREEELQEEFVSVVEVYEAFLKVKQTSTI